MRLLICCLLVVLAPAMARANDAQEQFDHHYVGIGDYSSTMPHGSNYWKEPFEGADHHKLSFTDFYERVGRPDLARRYRRRRGLKIGLAVSGAVVLVAGVAWLAAQYVDNNDAFQSCIDHSNPIYSSADVCSDAGVDKTGYIGGGVLAVAGFAGIIAGLTVQVQPVTPRDASDLANDYNWKLRHELGLDHEPPPDPQQKQPTIMLAPSADARSVGLRLVGRF